MPSPTTRTSDTKGRRFWRFCQNPLNNGHLPAKGQICWLGGLANPAQFWPCCLAICLPYGLVVGGLPSEAANHPYAVQIVAVQKKVSATLDQANDDERERSPNRSRPPDSLRRRLQARQSVRWQQLELQQILATQPWPGVAVWCDRRVDRSQVVDLHLQNETLQTVLDRLAQSCQAAVIVLDDVVVLLPQAEATRLPAVLADARRQVADLPQPLRQALLRSAERRWSRLAQPAQLWQEWLAPTKATTPGEPLPYDVWDAGSLPALLLIDQLTLLAFGFERRLLCQPATAGLQIELAPLTDDTAGEILVEDPHHIAQLNKLLSQWDNLFPQLQLSAKKPPRVAGTFGNLASFLDRLELNRPTPGTSSVAVNRYTVKIEGQTAEEVIRFIAQQTQRTIEIDDALGERLLTPIHLDVKELPLEELLQQVGSQAGVGVQLGNSQITVRRVPPSN